MAELSETAKQYIEDLKSCSREEALQKLATLRNMRIASPPKRTGKVKTKTEKLAAQVSPEFLKLLQKEGLV